MMDSATPPSSPSKVSPRSIIQWALSVPIVFKISGIALVVTALFGMAALYQIRAGMLRTHYQVHGEMGLSVASSLSARILPLIPRGDISAIDREVDDTMKTFPEIRYVIVLNLKNEIISHGFTFPREAPADLLQPGKDLCGACHASLSPKEVPEGLIETRWLALLPEGRVRAYSRREGMIIEVVAPIGRGLLGTIRLGVGDDIIAQEVKRINRSLLLTLALFLALGLVLALALTYALAHPIHNLVKATNRIREGNFHARATVYSQDEIGKLAVALNQMGEALENYRNEVRENEKARASLIGKIVQAQEDERKSVARELHDQLGQSLSNVLLMIESHCPECTQVESCCKIREAIRGLIDETRRLAWNVRPSILDDYGLDLALARYVKEVSERAGLQIAYQSVFPPGFERLPDRVEITLYRIAQEGITNTIRHSRATQASVILMCHDHEVSLLLEDNGCGFDMSTVGKTGSSLGLMGMRERAALVGGEITVDSEPGRGTVVRVRIPLDKPYGDTTLDC